MISDINKKASVDDATALHIAAKCNHVNAVKVLLKYDADIMAKLTNGQTPLHIACRKGYMEVVKVSFIALSQTFFILTSDIL